LVKGGNMKVISVVNQKGGCGKTTISINLGASLSKKNKKVLLIDLDPQAHATYTLDKIQNIYITDILEKISSNKVPETPLNYSYIEDNFCLIGSSIGLVSFEHKDLQENKFQIISNFLKIISNDFDYCILDCPPNLGILTLNALMASDYSLIPISICDFSVRGLELLKNIMIMLKEFKKTMPTPFYILNMVDKRYKFSNEFIDRIKKQLGSSLLNTVIRTNIHLREAVSYKKTIFQHKPNSRGAEDFIALADEIEKITSNNKWASLFLKKENLSDVYVVGDFNNWQIDEKYKLNKISNNIYSINIPLQKGIYRYKFIENGKWFEDPHNPYFDDDNFGGKNSLLFVE